MPTSMMAPIRAMSDMGVEVIHKARKTPVAANGMVNMMMNGKSSDSNCVAITMTIRMNSTPRSLKASPWSSTVPPISRSTPSGTGYPAMS